MLGWLCVSWILRQWSAISKETLYKGLREETGETELKMDLDEAYKGNGNQRLGFHGLLSQNPLS